MEDVNLEIHENFLLIDCFSSDIDYVLDCLENVPHSVLSKDHAIAGIVVDKCWSYDALLMLAHNADLRIV